MRNTRAYDDDFIDNATDVELLEYADNQIEQMTLDEIKANARINIVKKLKTARSMRKTRAKNK